MTDPTTGVTQQAVDLPLPMLPRAAGDKPEVKVAERQKQVSPAGPVIDVRLDGDTMRLYTEIRDPQTDRVLLRLPAVYRNKEAGPVDGRPAEP